MIKIILSAFVAAFLSSCSSSNYATDAMAPGAAPASARQIQRSGSMSMKSRSLKSSSDKSVSLVAKHNALITSVFRQSHFLPSWNRLRALAKSLQAGLT
jgi:uncharacterized lipoprotein YajG